MYTCAVKNEMTILTIVWAKRYVVTHNVQLYICAIQNGSCTSQVTSTTLQIQTTGIKDDVVNDDDQNTMTPLIAPAEPGTPVTLSGVIWKETMGGENDWAG